MKAKIVDLTGVLIAIDDLPYARSIVLLIVLDVLPPRAYRAPQRFRFPKQDILEHIATGFPTRDV